jgi:predicted RNA-binding protein YlxR (DUF448 family)
VIGMEYSHRPSPGAGVSPRSGSRRPPAKRSQLRRRHGAPYPLRTCVGCRLTVSPSEMIRLVLDNEGRVVPDLAGKAFGRGTWVHPTLECLARGVPKGVARSLRTSVKADSVAVVGAIRQAASRRVEGLLGSARAARLLAVGSAAVKDALDEGGAELLVVACDARAALETRRVRDAVADGRAAAWGTKTRLGGAVGRGDVGVVAVLNERIAHELRRSIALTHLGLPGSGCPGSEKHPSTEVR